MNGGYFLLDCTGLDLTKDTAQTITGSWNNVVNALKSDKPIMAYNCIYGTGKKVSPVQCFGWYLATDEIVIVGATLHIHVKNNDKCTVLDVVPST